MTAPLTSPSPQPPPEKTPGQPGVSGWKRVFLGTGLLAFLAVALLPSPLQDLGDYGNRPALTAAVAVLMAAWWLTEALPIAWTAALPLLLYPLLGVFGEGRLRDAALTIDAYADGYLLLFLGGMILGAAMEHTHLHRRIALNVMRVIGVAPQRLLLGVLAATAGLSMWISNTATAVMMLPIALALVKQMEAERGGTRLTGFGQVLMLAVAYGANVGGMGTKIGTGTNSIFAGFVEDQLGLELGFLQFMAIGLPFVVLMLPVLWGVLWVAGNEPSLAGGGRADVLERELAVMGPMSRDERRVGAVFLAAAVLWIAGDFLRPLVATLVAGAMDVQLAGKHYEAGVAMIAGTAVILLRCVTFSRLRRLRWDTLVLLGGSFALASGIEGSGLSVWMAMQLAVLADLPTFSQLALASFGTVALSAVASNTATINVMLNVMPRSLPVLGSAALAASCDFALPAGTPPNAIVFGSGYVRLPAMLRIGIVLDVIAAALLSVYAFVYVRHLFG